MICMYSIRNDVIYVRELRKATKNTTHFNPVLGVLGV